MGQQVGRVGEGTSTGLPPPQQQQQHPGKGNRGNAGRRPREVSNVSTGTPPGRVAAVNVPDPAINIFTQHSAVWHGQVTVQSVLLTRIGVVILIPNRVMKKEPFQDYTAASSKGTVHFSCH
ncbi:unnamed protein product [Oncorhynchus mykiss]|uniref:Uncharacterized protein n=1 Tax=Oncorhynchus mykiss TaxID=8022 RepID=A0A060WSD9_ONCMY|nr:unnamed protein product [Oncorhynchus mykiss]